MNPAAQIQAEPRAGAATFFLVRHAEVAGNTGPNRAFAGWTDLPVTQRGERQIEAVARRMSAERLDAVYSSPLQRAASTARAIAAEHGLTVQESRAWMEVNYGAWEGLGDAELQAQYADLWRQRVADPWSVAPPGGESYAHLWARMNPAWENLVAASAGKRVALVGHNGSLRVLLCHLLGAPFANARRLQIGNCSITKVIVETSPVDDEVGDPGGKLPGPPVVIQYINNICHLEGI